MYIINAFHVSFPPLSSLFSCLSFLFCCPFSSQLKFLRLYIIQNKREREDLLFSDSEAHITTYELYNQGKQYNVKNTSGTYCSSQPIDSNMPAPNFLNTTCHWEGPGNIFMKKANRFMSGASLFINIYIYAIRQRSL